MSVETLMHKKEAKPLMTPAWKETGYTTGTTLIHAWRGHFKLAVLFGKIN